MKFLLVIVLVFLARTTVEAEMYWASTAGGAGNCAAASGGSDPGTYRTLTQGISCLTAPGDILILKDGSYTNPGATVAAINCGSIGNGSSGNYKTIRAQNERMAVLQNDGLHASMTVTNCSWVKIEGLRMTSQANLSGTVTTLSLMIINGGSNNVIRRNLFHRTNVERYNADKGAVPDSTLVSNVPSESITIAPAAARYTGFHPAPTQTATVTIAYLETSYASYGAVALRWDTATGYFYILGCDATNTSYIVYMGATFVVVASDTSTCTSGTVVTGSVDGDDFSLKLDDVEVLTGIDATIAAGDCGIELEFPGAITDVDLDDFTCSDNTGGGTKHRSTGYR